MISMFPKRSREVTDEMSENRRVHAKRKGVTAMVLASTYAPGPYNPFERSRMNTARSCAILTFDILSA